MLSIEDKISIEIQLYLKKNLNKDAIYFYDNRLRGKQEYSLETSKYGEIGIIVQQAKNAKDGGKFIKVYKYNFKYL